MAYTFRYDISDRHRQWRFIVCGYQIKEKDPGDIVLLM